MIAFGQLLIAIPDLPVRLREDAALNEPNVATYYSLEPQGEVDYPSLPGTSDCWFFG